MNWRNLPTHQAAELLPPLPRKGALLHFFAAIRIASNSFSKEFAAMTKKRAHMARITFEVTPGLSAFLNGWAREEGRTLSGLVRHVLTGIADEKMAARNATYRRRRNRTANTETEQQYAT
jgi:hypothetical protein